MYKEVFKLRIKARREELAMTQNEVSDKTDIEQSKISKYENGNLEPNLETLGKIANCYEVSIDWLLGNIYHEKQGNLIKAALEEMYREVKEIVYGADEQNFSSEEKSEIIIANIEKAKNEITEKYSHS